MTDYSAYTIEAAFAVLIMAVAHKVYKMRCDSSSKCCGDTVAVRMHNEGDGQGEYELSQRQIPTQPQPEQQV
jgi:hypothetical protein